MLYKSHVRLTLLPPNESNLPTLPTDLVPLQECGTWILHRVGQFLVRKNMDYLYLPNDMMYSPSRERLMIPIPHGYSGRDLTERSNQKWMIYSPAKFVGTVSSNTTVVVEDLFSMYKVQWALRGVEGVQVVCSLGTALRPELFLNLIQKTRQVIMFYDGDSAGFKGAKVEAKRLNTAGIPAVSACAPEGFDPKDMRVLDIQQHIGEYH